MDAGSNIVTAENASVVEISKMNSLVTFKSPSLLWTENWFGLVVEFGVLALFLQACNHASRRGVKEVYLLVTLLVAATGIEMLQQIPHDGYELWWYHESAVNLFQHKVPLYILCSFALIYYWVDYAFRDLNLPQLTKSLANAVGSIAVSFPLLRLAPNYLLMMFHFDDDVFKDRTLNVPFSEITYLFLLFFHVGHLYNAFYDEIEVQDRNFLRYFRCAFQSGAVSAAFSLVEFFLLYIVFRLILKQSSGWCFLSALVILGFLAKDEINENVQAVSSHGLSVFKRKEWLYLVPFFAMVCLVPIMVHPEDVASNGVRLELGPCDTIHSVSNMSPLHTFRRRYICPNGTEKFGFDFHCVAERELHSAKIRSHYMICGAAFSNSVKVCETLVWYSFVVFVLFHRMFSLKVTLKKEAAPRETKKID